MPKPKKADDSTGMKIELPSKAVTFPLCRVLQLGRFFHQWQWLVKVGSIVNDLNNQSLVWDVFDSIKSELAKLPYCSQLSPYTIELNEIKGVLAETSSGKGIKEVLSRDAAGNLLKELGSYLKRVESILSLKVVDGIEYDKKELVNVFGLGRCLATLLYPQLSIEDLRNLATKSRVAPLNCTSFLTWFIQSDNYHQTLVHHEYDTLVSIKHQLVGLGLKCDEPTLPMGFHQRQDELEKYVDLLSDSLFLSRGSSKSKKFTSRLRGVAKARRNEIVLKHLTDPREDVINDELIRYGYPPLQRGTILKIISEKLKPKKPGK